MTRHRLLFIALVLLQLLVLAAMIGVKQYTLSTGSEVLLRTVPVDPRSLFRGDYVMLRYEISSLDGRLFVGDKEPMQQGSVAWVTLAPGADGYWHATAVADRRPAAGPGQVILKGRVEWAWEEEISLRYGIEQFFVPEGEGRPLEDRERTLDVVAKVDRFGNAALFRALLDGEEVDWR